MLPKREMHSERRIFVQNGEVDAAALENSISVDQLRELLDSDAEVLVYVDNAVDKAREDFKQQSSSGESKC